MAAPLSPNHDPYFSTEGKDAKKGPQPARTQTSLEPLIAHFCPSTAAVCRAFWAMSDPEARSPIGFLRGLGLALAMSLEVLAIVMTMLNTPILFGVVRQP